LVPSSTHDDENLEVMNDHDFGETFQCIKQIEMIKFCWFIYICKRGPNRELDVPKINVIVNGSVDDSLKKIVEPQRTRGMFETTL
jgi:hypothetical protein